MSELRNCRLIAPTPEYLTERVRLPLVRLPYPWMDESCERRRYRSPITMPGYGKGRVPANRGVTYKKTPPTVEEGYAIIAALKTLGGGTSYDVRNAALVALIWRSGLRVHEALLLTPPDVDFDHHVVHVRRGKGGKERWSIIDDYGLSELQVWLNLRADLGGFSDADPIFCVLEGATRGGRMSQPYVRVKLKQAAAKAGVDKRVSCHQWRHAHARQLRKGGVELPGGT